MDNGLKSRITDLVADRGKIKLHLGCGDSYHEDYINIDLSHNKLADVHMDFFEIDGYFGSASVDEILMIHSLNYLNLWQAKDFFLKAHSLLHQDGVLVIETPNILNAVSKIVRCNKSNLSEYLEGVRALHAFDMEQIRDRDRFTPYAFSWSPWHLESELSAAGFDHVVVLPPRTHERWRDMRVEAYKHERHSGRAGENAGKPGAGIGRFLSRVIDNWF